MYKNLKRRVLEISKREINVKTNITFSYTELKKQGRKVVAINLNHAKTTGKNNKPR